MTSAFRPLLAVFTLATLGVASAAEGISYDFVELGLRSTSLEGPSILGASTSGRSTGAGAAFSASLGARFYVAGEYQSDSSDYTYGVLPVESELGSLGLRAGWHAPLRYTTDAFLELGYGQVAQDQHLLGVLVSSIDESGLSLRAGLRQQVGERIEVGLAVRNDAYADLGTSFGLEASYRFSESLAASIGYSAGELADAATLGVRWYY